MNNPNPQAALHIVSPDKGVLLPQISLTASATFLGGATASASQTGMLVYNTNTDTSSSTGLLGEGYYFWNGTHWERFQGSTDALTDLDGDTQIQVEEGTDDDSIRFDTAGEERMVIDQAGSTSLSGSLEIIGNVITTLTATGTSQVILTSANPSGFEAYDGANTTEYNGVQSNGVISTLFNQTFETVNNSYHITRTTAGVDWGVGYSFENDYNFTSIRLRSRSDCCGQRTGGGEFRVYDNGTLVATSTTIAVSGEGVWTTAFSPNVIGDEVRYIFPNGVDTNLSDGIFNPVEFEISGQETELATVVDGSTGTLVVTGNTTFNSSVGIGTDSPTHSLTVSGTAQVTGQLYDSSGDAGTAGQVLSSSAGGTNWVNASEVNFSGLPVYADDAAADADSTLPSGYLYRVTGSRELRIKL